jgi:hypothetical protein
MSVLLADYEPQRLAFEYLLNEECRQSILLLRGQSGSGKTTLLKACLDDIPENINLIRIQLRNSAVGVAEIFSRSGICLDWKFFPKFTTRVAELTGGQRVQIDSNWLAGINNSISVALNVDDPMDRKDRRANLTDAWFDDLKAIEQLILIALDTYEDAVTEVQEWISGPLMSRLIQIEHLRIVLAGQKIPDRNNIEWGHCCTEYELFGVHEAEHWMPVVKAMGRAIPVEHPIAWLAGICHALKGQPDEIMKIIEALPQQQGAS